MNRRVDPHWPRSRLSIVCGLLAWIGALLMPAAVAAGAGFKLLLLAPADAELTARVRGQTRDLGVVLEVLDPPAQLSSDAALHAGREHQAQVVVWAEQVTGLELELHILDVQSGELRSRTVSTPPRETLASSTTAEMGALVVRSELSSLLAEQEAKAEERQRAPVENAPAAAAQPEISNKVPVAPIAPGPRPLPPGPWLLSLAYRLSRPFKSQLAHGFAAGVRRDLSGFALGLSAAATLPLQLSNAGTRIAVHRVELRLETLKHWTPVAPLRLLLGLSGHLAIDLRSTRSVGTELAPANDAATASGGFGLFAEAQWLFSRRVGGYLAGGADAVPWRTKFIIQSDTGETRVATLSWLDPWLTVGLFTRF